MPKRTKIIVMAGIVLVVAFVSFLLLRKVNPNPNYEIGQVSTALTA